MLSAWERRPPCFAGRPVTGANRRIAVDYQGSVLAYQDYFRTADRTMLADVPTRGVRTPYALLGDWFAYLCSAFVVGLIGWAVYARIRRPAA